MSRVDSWILHHLCVNIYANLKLHIQHEPISPPPHTPHLGATRRCGAMTGERGKYIVRAICTLQLKLRGTCAVPPRALYSSRRFLCSCTWFDGKLFSYIHNLEISCDAVTILNVLFVYNTVAFILNEYCVWCTMKMPSSCSRQVLFSILNSRINQIYTKETRVGWLTILYTFIFILYWLQDITWTFIARYINDWKLKSRILIECLWCAREWCTIYTYILCDLCRLSLLHNFTHRILYTKKI